MEEAVKMREGCRGKYRWASNLTCIISADLEKDKDKGQVREEMLEERAEGSNSQTVPGVSHSLSLSLCLPLHVCVPVFLLVYIKDFWDDLY